MLESAHQLFREQGYESTSTRQICDLAGVSESMLFRHFGSKTVIFDEAVLKPFVEFLRSFIDDWAERAPADVVPERLAHSYVAGFLRLCNDNLHLIAVLGERNVDGGQRPAAHQVRVLMQEHLDTLASQIDSYHAQIGIPTVVDSHLAIRLAITVTVGHAYLGDGFLGAIGGQAVDEIAAFIVRGAGYPSDGRVGS